MPAPEAHEYYLKGFQIHWHTYINDRTNNLYFEEAEKMFTNAIYVDSSYSDAYAGLADLYDTKSFIDDKYIRKRDSVINAGYKIDSSSAYILALKGYAYIFRGRGYITSNEYLDSAFYYFKKAHQIDATNIVINTLLSEGFNRIGLLDNSINISRRIISSDPLNLYARARNATFLFKNGQVQESKEAFRKLHEIDPNNQDMNSGLFAIATLHDRDINEAREIFELERSNSNWRFGKSQRSWLLALEGKKEEALSLDRSLVVYSLLGMNNEALNLIDSLGSLNNFTNFWTYPFLNTVKSTDFIKDEPKFKEILARAKVVYDEREAKYGHLYDEE